MSTYAGRYGPEAMLETSASGHLTRVPAAVTFQVRKATDGTAASLYADRTKAAPAANPVLLDAEGNLGFFADSDVDYRLHRVVGGVEQADFVVVAVAEDRAEDSGALPGGAAGGSLAGTYPNPSLAGLSVGTAQLAAGAAALDVLRVDAAGTALEWAVPSTPELASAERTSNYTLVTEGVWTDVPLLSITAATDPNRPAFLELYISNVQVDHADPGVYVQIHDSVVGDYVALIALTTSAVNEGNAIGVIRRRLPAGRSSRTYKARVFMTSAGNATFSMGAEFPGLLTLTSV